jgi:hypothetical protein
LFEVSSDEPVYPDSDAAAEAVRMQWLEGWMKRTGHCPGGWEILSRSTMMW